MPYKHFTHDERLMLSAFLRTDLTQKEIALKLGKDPSSVSRELGRNGAESIDGYRVRKAQVLTIQRRIQANQRFKKIENDPWLENYIKKKLKLYWSPEQIAGRLREKHERIICHETIYQYIYKDHPELKKYLRCTKGRYRRRYGTKKREKAREEAKKKRIDTRPLVVEKRGRIGDWEGDTIVSKCRKKAILTHAERRSGYLLAAKLENTFAENTADMVVEGFRKIPRKKILTITYDNGREFGYHEYIERMTESAVYFAYPYHSWERGTNENTNGLLRFFFPKGTYFADIAQKDIDKAVKLINNRPRKRLSYLTPDEVFRKNCTLD